MSLDDALKKSEGSRAPEPEKGDKLLSYNKAERYIKQKAPILEATQLLANIPPDSEKKDDFFYRISTLDREIAEAREKGYFRKSVRSIKRGYINEFDEDSE
ncbi:hypothetical protein JXB27_00345 [Candidatus Woesearchaeota archaeon]|nr:hypothetical protein [Candidatus Woesearchaeota archaeon]